MATRLRTPPIESTSDRWEFLECLSGKPEAYVKGRRLRASTVWRGMTREGMTEDEAAANWDLLPGAVREIIRYCEANETYLGDLVDEERSLLNADGYPIAPPPARRR